MNTTTWWPQWTIILVAFLIPSSRAFCEMASTANGAAVFNDPSQYENQYGAASNKSETASNDQLQGVAMNTGSAAVFTAAGFYFNSTVPPNPPMATFSFIQAGLGLTQAGVQGATASGNGTMSNSFRTNSTGGFGGYGGIATNGSGTSPNGSLNPKISGNIERPDKNPTDPSIKGGPQDRGSSGKSVNAFAKNYLPKEALDTLSKLKSAGYNVDFEKQTITTPDGTTISASDAANPSTLESKLGLPEGTAAKGNAMAQELMEKKLSMANGNGSSPGAGSLDGLLEDGSLAGEVEGGGVKKRAEEGKTAGGTGSNRLPASALVAGMTAQYKGENIGVASDDIFSMVQRRYQLKQEQDSFLIMEQSPSLLPQLNPAR